MILSELGLSEADEAGFRLGSFQLRIEAWVEDYRPMGNEPLYMPVVMRRAGDSEPWVKHLRVRRLLTADQLDSLRDTYGIQWQPNSGRRW